MKVLRWVQGLGFGVLIFSFLSCGPSHEEAPRVEPRNVKGNDYTTPTRQLPLNQYPFFEDDIDFDWLETAISRQLQRFQKKDLSGTIRLGMTEYPLSLTKKSLEVFLQLAQDAQFCLERLQNPKQRRSCYELLSNQIKNQFDVFAPNLSPKDPRFGDPNPTLFTGYYTPLIPVKKSPDALYRFPIYKKPMDKNLARKTRKEIDFQGAFQGKNLELFYSKDLFALYLLHVEGGGRVKVLDGQPDEEHYLSYDGTNRQSWRFISKYMMKQGMISSGSIQAQREYLDQHPEKWEEIYSTCPSYVFFERSQRPPIGSDDVSLTDRRSIATDRRHYAFKGLLSFVQARRPLETQLQFQNYSRFYLDQDTGGAIKGKARADIYFGEGEYAELAASNTYLQGKLYFLILKK